MAKGTRYTPEFKAKAVRLLTESRGSYSSETKAIEQVAKDLGVAPETLRRWRNKTDATVAAETKQSAEDAMAELNVLLQCLFDRFGSVFPQCGLMVFPGAVIVSR